MPRTKIVMLHVSAIDCGTHYVIINRNGRRTGKLKHDDTGPMSESQLRRQKRRIGWDRIACKMVAGLLGKARRKQKSEWDKKIETWQKSISLRVKHTRPAAVGKRFFSDDSRPDWCRAFECMLRQYYNKVVRKKRHAADPWALWSETVSQNHNRKQG
jgi:hypothetical protein